MASFANSSVENTHASERGFTNGVAVHVRSHLLLFGCWIIGRGSHKSFLHPTASEGVAAWQDRGRLAQNAHSALFGTGTVDYLRSVSAGLVRRSCQPRGLVSGRRRTGLQGSRFAIRMSGGNFGLSKRSATAVTTDDGQNFPGDITRA